eukprot:9439055-Lingulodinium_polyedra.AAC.1
MPSLVGKDANGVHDAIFQTTKCYADISKDLLECRGFSGRGHVERRRERVTKKRAVRASSTNENK